MQSLQNKKSLIIFALIYSLVVMVAMLFPFYLYVQESIENLKNQEITRVKNETSEIKLQVCITSNIKAAASSREDYKIAFFDKKGGVIHSNDSKFHFINYDYHSGIDGDDIYEYMNLRTPREGAVKFIVIKTVDYSPLIERVLFLSVYILLFLIISSGTLIYVSTKSLSQTNRYIEQFFNDAMHEIRTPLGIIQLNLDMLSETIKKSNEALLNRTQAATKSLASIYEDIEYFIKHQKVNFVKEKVNLSEFLLNRVMFIEVLAKIKNIVIKIDIDKDIKYQFNRIELQRIIDNNLSNAIKYSKENTTINVSLKKEQNKLYLVFKDQGRGIADVTKVFTRYYRGDEIKGGFGLGLSIVGNICKKYDIEIKVESQLKKGSKFTYILNIT